MRDKKIAVILVGGSVNWQICLEGILAICSHKLKCSLDAEISLLVT